MSPPLRAQGKGDCGIPMTFTGSEEQHGALPPGWGPAMPVFPVHSQHWPSLSPWPCSHRPVYPILLSPSSAHSCSSLGGRLGGPQDMVPCPGSSPAICHPLARIKRTGISWPPAEMPAGWEGKLRHEAGRSEAMQGAGSKAKRRLHAQFILFKVTFFPCRNCPASHPTPPR